MASGTLFEVLLTTDSDGWDGYTGVERIQTSAMTLPSNVIMQLRFKFQAASVEGFSVGNAYVGHRAGSGDVYDFSTTPVPILFGGSASIDIIAGAEVWSDWVTFGYNKTSDLLVSFYCGGGGFSDAPKIASGISGVADYEKIANDAATVNKNGYSVNDGFIGVINTIEYIAAVIVVPAAVTVKGAVVSPTVAMALVISPSTAQGIVLVVDPSVVMALVISPSTAQGVVSVVDPSVVMALILSPNLVGAVVLTMGPIVIGGGGINPLGEGDSPGFIAFMISHSFYVNLTAAGLGAGLNEPDADNSAEWETFLFG